MCVKGVTFPAGFRVPSPAVPTVGFMPRAPRAFVEGIYHLISHASDTRDLFVSGDDRTRFLDRLAFVIDRFELRLVEYALLGNHYHLVLATPGGRISKALQQLHTWFSFTQNGRQNRRAHLFLAHPFARELQSDEELLVACRYVAHNPVAAGLCRDPFSWPWSSAAAVAGLTDSAIPLDHGPIRAALGDTEGWRLRYRAFIEAGEDT